MYVFVTFSWRPPVLVHTLEASIFLSITMYHLA